MHDCILRDHMLSTYNRNRRCSSEWTSRPETLPHIVRRQLNCDVRCVAAWVAEESARLGPVQPQKLPHHRRALFNRWTLSRGPSCRVVFLLVFFSHVSGNRLHYQYVRDPSRWKYLHASGTCLTGGRPSRLTGENGTRREREVYRRPLHASPRASRPRATLGRKCVSASPASLPAAMDG